MVGTFSRILPKRPASKNLDGWKIENLPATPADFAEKLLKDVNVSNSYSAWHAAVAADETAHAPTNLESKCQSAEIDDEEGTSDASGNLLELANLVESQEGADEASLKVWGAYQCWRVTKIRLGGMLLNREIPLDPPQSDFPSADSLYSSILSSFALGT